MKHTIAIAIVLMATTPCVVAAETPEPEDAIRKSLGLIASAWKAYPREDKTCFTCHNHAMPVLALTIARDAGYEIQDGIVKQIATHGQHDYARRYERIAKGQGVGGRSNSASYALTLLRTADWPGDQTTEALVDYLMLNQKEDGHWETPSHRPPSGASDFTTTALSARNIHHYATESQKEKAWQQIWKAREWLFSSIPVTTEDMTFHLLGLYWLQAPQVKLNIARRVILGEQHENGGWAQRSDMEPDAYATGQVLMALKHSGQIAADHPAYRRGIEFLLQTQKADGSWHVITRADPIQDYYESGFPHGEDQFISLNATCWATIALAYAHPSP
ncbi:MAG: prenyltransferase/squalene oxidase repeat-containing protein [Planctomycetota bacterium]